MIRKWLLQHRIINELGKTLAAVILGLFACSSWNAGKIASIEIVPSESYKLMVFGIVAGILGMLALFIFLDVIYSLQAWRKRKKEA